MQNDYKNTPVAGFGEKVLGKMGWFQGRGIGKNSSEEIPVYLNYIRREGREDRNGLGSDKSIITKKKAQLQQGSTIEVISGKHKGIIGVILEIQEENALIEIKNNSNHIKIPLRVLIESDNKNLSQTVSLSRPLKWVLPGLKVRIRSKTAHKGSLYNTKAYIEDVLDTHKFTVRVKIGIIDDLTEKDIETVIPGIGGSVRIVKGPHKSEVAKLLTRDKRKNVVTVQALDGILALTQDDVCEFYQEI